MKEVSAPIALWLEQKRRSDRTSAAVIAALALASGTAVFLLISFLIYGVLSLVCAAYVSSVRWPAPVALGLTAWLFVRWMKARPEEQQLVLDPMGFWIIKDLASIGPRLVLEGLRQMRCYELLGELNVAACAGALAYLAGQNAAVTTDELM